MVSLSGFLMKVSSLIDHLTELLMLVTGDC